jgi:quercetin dioxygenase-like cupin family protein
VIRRAGGARQLAGREHGAGVSLILVDAEPGDGPRLHRHPYEELFVVHEGTATFRVGAGEVPATAGDVVVVPPNTPHGFVNSGSDRLRLTAIHHAPAFETEWLE